MARLFSASEEQQGIIADIVSEDAAAFLSADMGEAVKALTSSVELMVHDDVIGPLPRNIAHGLPQSPYEISPDERAVFLSGAREVGMEVAAYLAASLAGDVDKVLYIPHAYAMPAEIESLQDEFGARVLEVIGRVYIRCSGRDIDPELVRRAIGSMMCGYSVGWLLDSDIPEGTPCSAIVPVFDGEGWAILGKSIVSPMKKH